MDTLVMIFLNCSKHEYAHGLYEKSATLIKYEYNPVKRGCLLENLGTFCKDLELNLAEEFGEGTLPRILVVERISYDGPRDDPQRSASQGS